jgi:hypothetical protein
MELPAGYRLRAPALDDLDAVADVLIADQLDDAGQIVLGVDFLRAEWSRAGLNLAADAWWWQAVRGRSSRTCRPGQRNRSWSSAGGVVHPGHRRAASARFCWI